MEWSSLGCCRCIEIKLVKEPKIRPNVEYYKKLCVFYTVTHHKIKLMDIRCLWSCLSKVLECRRNIVPESMDQVGDDQGATSAYTSLTVDNDFPDQNKKNL